MTTGKDDKGFCHSRLSGILPAPVLRSTTKDECRES